MELILSHSEQLLVQNRRGSANGEAFHLVEGLTLYGMCTSVQSYISRARPALYIWMYIDEGYGLAMYSTFDFLFPLPADLACLSIRLLLQAASSSSPESWGTHDKEVLNDRINDGFRSLKRPVPCYESQGLSCPSSVFPDEAYRTYVQYVWAQKLILSMNRLPWEAMVDFGLGDDLDLLPQLWTRVQGYR